MELKEFTKKLFTEHEVEDRQSTVYMLLRVAREYSGRDPETGDYDHRDLNEPDFEKGLYISKKFIGLFLYLMLLEVIGEIFKDTTNKKNGIKRALELFSYKISNDNINAIAQLRNGLAHNFGLCSKGRNRASSFLYSLSWFSENNSIVTPAPPPWDGTFSGKKDKNYTEINVEKLIEHIEEIYKNVIVKLEQDELEVIPTKDELKYKYTIM